MPDIFSMFEKASKKTANKGVVLLSDPFKRPVKSSKLQKSTACAVRRTAPPRISRASAPPPNTGQNYVDTDDVEVVTSAKPAPHPERMSRHDKFAEENSSDSDTVYSLRRKRVISSSSSSTSASSSSSSSSSSSATDSDAREHHTDSPTEEEDEDTMDYVDDVDAETEGLPHGLLSAVHCGFFGVRAQSDTYLQQGLHRVQVRARQLAQVLCRERGLLAKSTGLDGGAATALTDTRVRVTVSLVSDEEEDEGARSCGGLRAMGGRRGREGEAGEEEDVRRLPDLRARAALMMRVSCSEREDRAGDAGHAGCIADARASGAVAEMGVVGTRVSERASEEDEAELDRFCVCQWARAHTLPAPTQAHGDYATASASARHSRLCRLRLAWARAEVRAAGTQLRREVAVIAAAAAREDVAHMDADVAAVMAKEGVGQGEDGAGESALRPHTHPLALPLNLLAAAPLAADAGCPVTVTRLSTGGEDGEDGGEDEGAEAEESEEGDVGYAYKDEDEDEGTGDVEDVSDAAQDVYADDGARQVSRSSPPPPPRARTAALPGASGAADTVAEEVAAIVAEAAVAAPDASSLRAARRVELLRTQPLGLDAYTPAQVLVLGTRSDANAALLSREQLWWRGAHTSADAAGLSAVALGQWLGEVEAAQLREAKVGRGALAGGTPGPLHAAVHATAATHASVDAVDAAASGAAHRGDCGGSTGKEGEGEGVEPALWPSFDRCAVDVVREAPSMLRSGGTVDVTGLLHIIRAYYSVAIAEWTKQHHAPIATAIRALVQPTHTQPTHTQPPSRSASALYAGVRARAQARARAATAGASSHGDAAAVSSLSSLVSRLCTRDGDSALIDTIEQLVNKQQLLSLLRRCAPALARALRTYAYVSIRLHTMASLAFAMCRAAARPTAHTIDDALSLISIDYRLPLPYSPRPPLPSMLSLALASMTAIAADANWAALLLHDVADASQRALAMATVWAWASTHGAAWHHGVVRRGACTCTSAVSGAADVAGVVGAVGAESGSFALAQPPLVREWRDVVACAWVRCCAPLDLYSAAGAASSSALPPLPVDAVRVYECVMATVWPLRVLVSHAQRQLLALLCEQLQRVHSSGWGVAGVEMVGVDVGVGSGAGKGGKGGEYVYIDPHVDAQEDAAGSQRSASLLEQVCMRTYACALDNGRESTCAACRRAAHTASVQLELSGACVPPLAPFTWPLTLGWRSCGDGDSHAAQRTHDVRRPRRGAAHDRARGHEAPTSPVGPAVSGMYENASEESEGEGEGESGDAWRRRVVGQGGRSALTQMYEDEDEDEDGVEANNQGRRGTGHGDDSADSALSLSGDDDNSHARHASGRKRHRAVPSAYSDASSSDEDLSVVAARTNVGARARKQSKTGILDFLGAPGTSTMDPFSLQLASAHRDAPTPVRLPKLPKHADKDLRQQQLPLVRGRRMQYGFEDGKVVRDLQQRRLFEYKDRRYDPGWGGVDTIYDNATEHEWREARRVRGARGGAGVSGGARQATDASACGGDAGAAVDDGEVPYYVKLQQQGLLRRGDEPSDAASSSPSSSSASSSSSSSASTTALPAPVVPAHTLPTLALPSPRPRSFMLGSQCAHRLLLYRAILWWPLRTVANMHSVWTQACEQQAADNAPSGSLEDDEDGLVLRQHRHAPAVFSDSPVDLTEGPPAITTSPYRHLRPIVSRDILSAHAYPVPSLCPPAFAASALQALECQVERYVCETKKRSDGDWHNVVEWINGVDVSLLCDSVRQMAHCQ